ncbi:methylmalonyl-CoA mutase family protein [Adhaeribacter radiodurans]|uniref:Methylmalonyl-CoA mutase n=1 Tax=Adhaeribacter radiodurans TaxID=2745197 RepID=A0A7L7L7S7_9BACT|nr:methylmalonyl-CoA mutase family protein [Adhaeribacter radiodurans]QMU28882.1 methylmalonyl-CoA mutase [Adhaeribacter radiodurans]
MPDSLKRLSLFPEFKKISGSEWANKVRKDLKGEDPESLTWHSPEGITIQPCYHSEDLADQPLTEAIPVQYPFVRGHKTANNNWENIAVITVSHNFCSAVDKGAKAVEQGADGLHFILQDKVILDFNYLLQHIDYNRFSISFTVSQKPTDFLKTFYNVLQELHISTSVLRGFIYFNLSEAHTFYTRSYYDELAALLKVYQDNTSYKLLSINGAGFAFKGGTVVQEIAYTISAAVACLDELTNRGIPAELVARNMHFQLAVGTNYFFEMAKLRAIRLLWATIIKSYGLDLEAAAALRVHSQTSRWHQTTFDPHINLLRTTTEAMAAVLGGCDSLAVCSFDNTIRPENEFSERIARNISLLLKEEAYLHQIIDPAAGSYYLETLTSQLAESAWQIFQDLEKTGGFVANWQNNYIKNSLNEVAQQKFKKVASGEDILVGTNKFINPKEKFDYDPEKLIQSNYFDTTRAAYSLEVMRFAVELHYLKRRQKPKVVIASVGDAIQRHLNASFAKEFFGCAGFTTEIQHFNSVTEAAQALPLVSGEVIVLSSSTKEYQSFAQQIGPALKSHKNKPAIILAANPHHMKAELKEQGFDEFLFQGCDTTTIVARIQEHLQKEQTIDS